MQSPQFPVEMAASLTAVEVESSKARTGDECMEGERHAHSRQNQPAFLLGLWEERERMRRGSCNQGLRMVAVKTK